MHVPTVAEVDAIAAIADPVVRNLRITQCYHELACAVAARVGPGANWCTFATWASRQAGQTIRGEDLARAVDGVLGAPEVRVRLERVAALAAREARLISDRTLAAAARRALDPEAAIRRASAAVAIGNRKVFAEIGREFARWLATAARDQTPATTAAFLAGLRDGEPPEGQRLLREAFGAYGEACTAADGDARAERLLLGNLLVGMHEQTRLQPEIAAALDAALDADTVRRELLALVLPPPVLRARARIGARLGRPLPLDEAVDALVGAVRDRVRVVVTEALMTLQLPGEVVRLGRDVHGGFPPELARLDHPPLRALVARVDPHPDTPLGSGARDWASLDERMHLIADLFRCWHARPELLDPPYDAVQVAAMREGRRPEGRL